MGKMTSYTMNKAHWSARELFNRDFYKLMERDQEICMAKAVELCKNPPDVRGTPISVGDTVAVGVTAGRSATIMVGKVTEIHPDKGIQVEELYRTYGCDKGSKKRYGFPDRMVVIS